MNLNRYAEVTAHLTIWYARQPAPKPTCFTCKALSDGTGYSMPLLYLPLLMSGWHRAEVWHRSGGRRVKRVYYAPPGHQVPRPPRGRPRFNLTDYVTITIS